MAKVDAIRVRDFLREQVAPLENPRSIGQALQGSRFAGLWRYRVGNFRVLCEIQDERVVVLVVGIENRRDVYR